MMMRKRADALQAVGRDDEATLTRVELAWDELDRARFWEAGFALSDGVQTGAPPTVDAFIERARSVAEGAVWAAKGRPLDDFVVAFDGLMPGDPCRERAAAFLAEEAIAADLPELLINRLAGLQSIADEASKGSAATAWLAIRLRMCLADATGEWRDLLWEIHREHPRSMVAWAHARYARALALAGDGPGARDNYLEAIERACTEEMFDEAADWLYALRTVRSLYERSFDDDEHPRALALRPYAKPSSLPGSPHTKELALAAMLDQKDGSEAWQRCGRWRWQAVVRAQLTDEFASVEDIGMLQERQGDAEAAIESFVRAGAEKKAKEAAGNLPERTAHVDLRILRALPDSRGTAYAAAASAGDLLDDNCQRVDRPGAERNHR
jgi:hypothetical protein